MDTVTQVVLGATVAEAGFGARLGRAGVIFGACCGLLPDLDIVCRLGGPWTMLIYHRGLSHSLLILSVLSPLVGWIGFYCAGKRDSYLRWCHLAFWALITHPLLDLCTSYGTQLWAPLSNRRYALDAVAIIDLFYSLPLVWVVFQALRGRQAVARRVRQAWIVLFLTTVYLGLGYGQTQRAISLARQQLQREGFQIAQIRATPALLSVWLWRVIARNQHGDLRMGMVSTLVPRPITFYDLPRPHHPFVAKALADRYGRIFLWFAMDMVSIEVRTRGPNTWVLLHDQRYGLITRPRYTIFQAKAVFDQQGRLLSFELQPYRLSKVSNLGAELVRTWQLLWGQG